MISQAHTQLSYWSHLMHTTNHILFYQKHITHALNYPDLAKCRLLLTYHFHIFQHTVITILTISKSLLFFVFSWTIKLAKTEALLPQTTYLKRDYSVKKPFCISVSCFNHHNHHQQTHCKSYCLYCNATQFCILSWLIHFACKLNKILNQTIPYQTFIQFLLKLIFSSTIQHFLNIPLNNKHKSWLLTDWGISQVEARNNIALGRNYSYSRHDWRSLLLLFNLVQLLRRKVRTIVSSVNWNTVWVFFKI